MDNLIALCVILGVFGLISLSIGIWSFCYNLKYDDFKEKVGKLQTENLTLIAKNEYLENRVCELNKLISHFDSSVLVSKTTRKSSKK